MQAWLVRFDPPLDGTGYQIMYGGVTVRVADMDGNTVNGAIGYTTIDTNPTAPPWLDADPVIEDPPPPPPPDERMISKVALLRRATLDERVALEMAQIDNTEATMEQRGFAARLRVWFKELEMMKAVNLADPVVRGGLEQLEAFAIIGPGRAAAILDTPIADDEIPNGV